MPIVYGIALGMAGVRVASSQIVAIVGRHEKAPGWPGAGAQALAKHRIRMARS